MKCACAADISTTGTDDKERNGEDMKEIHFDDIAQTVAALAIDACYRLPSDMTTAIRAARMRELSPVGCNILEQLLENAEIAAKGSLP